MAAWVPEMFHNLLLAKNHKISNNLTTAEAREKISADLESLDFFVHFTELKNNQLLLNKGKGGVHKSSPIFLVPAKLHSVLM